MRVIRRFLIHTNWQCGYANEPCACLFTYANEISLQVTMRDLLVCTESHDHCQLHVYASRAFLNSIPYGFYDSFLSELLFLTVSHKTENVSVHCDHTQCYTLRNPKRIN